MKCKKKEKSYFHVSQERVKVLWRVPHVIWYLKKVCMTNWSQRWMKKLTCWIWLMDSQRRKAFRWRPSHGYVLNEWSLSIHFPDGFGNDFWFCSVIGSDLVWGVRWLWTAGWMEWQFVFPKRSKIKEESKKRRAANDTLMHTLDFYFIYYTVKWVFF